MILDEEEVQEFRAKRRDGRPLKQAEEQQQSSLVREFRDLTAAIETAITKVREQPDITVAAPNVKVEAPSVTVEAPSAPKQIFEWECEITQRDNSGRMKKLKLRAIT